jgi:hypothetical protein
MEKLTHINSNEQPTKYRVSTITCNASISTTIDLTKLFEHISLTENTGFIWIENGTKKRGIYPAKKKKSSQQKEKKCFDNQVTVIYKYGEYYPNIKIFRNGNIQMTGVRTVENGQDMVNIITNELKKIATEKCESIVGTDKIESIVNTNFIIRMINTDFGVPFKIRRKNLHQLLISSKYGNTCSFQPLTYPGVKLQYFYNIQNNKNNGICSCTKPCFGKGTGDGDGNCKKVTIAIFDSGKILITGANSFLQINEAYRFICSVIMENQDELKKSFGS